MTKCRPATRLVMLLALCTAGCTTESGTLDGPPSGSAPLSVGVGSRPYGLAVWSGHAVVTQLDAASVTRLMTDAAPADIGAFATGSVPTGIAVTRDGGYVLVASQGDGSVTLHDGASGAVITRFSMRGSPVRALFSPDGSRGFAVSTSGELLIIDVPARTAVATVALGLSVPNGLALGRQSVYVSATDGDVVAVDLRTGYVARRYVVAGRLQEVVVSPDESMLYVADENGFLDELTLSSGTLRRLPVAAAFGAAMTGDGTQLWVTQPSAGTVSVVDRAGFRVLQTLTLSASRSSAPRRIAFDRSTAVISDESGFVHVLR